MQPKPQTTPATDTADEWETVAEARTKMLFDTDGDEFIGFYEGPELIEDPNTGEAYEYLNFRNDDGAGVTTPANYQLGRAFGDMPTGSYVKITRLGTSKTDKGTMTNFKVQRRRS